MNAKHRQVEKRVRAWGVKVVVLLIGVGLIGLSSESTTTRSQEPPKQPTMERAEPPWVGLSAESLAAEARAGRNVNALLSERSPGQACPLAIDYLRLLAGGRKLADCKPADLNELAVQQSFWLTAIYLIRNSETSVGIDWAARVWREVVYLPDDCHFEGGLFDAGGGDLLRALFAGCGKLSASPLRSLLDSLPVDEPDEALMTDLWDYFTSYGGDSAAGDPVVKLDEFAAALDLNPSYRAKWRKRDIEVKLVAKLKSWTPTARWEFMMAGIRLRKSKPDSYSKIRAELLTGKQELTRSVFDG